MTLIHLLVVLGVYALLITVTEQFRAEPRTINFIRIGISVFFVIYLLKASGLLLAGGIAI